MEPLPSFSQFLEDTLGIKSIVYTFIEAPKPVPYPLKQDSIFECDFCRTNTTPEKRTGPRGRKTLCNRCGLKWKKQQQKSKAVTAS